jgi:ribosomal-protein-alanine N-acetyltransferase
MGPGPFDPRLWQVLHRGEEPCAVMLLNHLSSGDAMELAYLGLSPSMRGRGLGRSLMQHGLEMASRYGAREMLLAVDENNTPALKLYRSLKFTPTARKLALLRRVAPFEKA